MLLLLPFLPAFPVSAEEEAADSIGDHVPPEYEDFLAAIPEDIREYLPEELFSADSGTLADGAGKLSDFSYLLETVLRTVGLRLGDCLRLLAQITGLLLLSAVASALRDSMRSESVGRAFSFCSTLAILTALLSGGYTTVRVATNYFSTLGKMTSAAIPLLATLYAMGGNVTAAASGAAGLTVYLTLTEELVGKTVVPFAGVCLAFAAMEAVDSNMRLGTLAATVKKQYTTLLAFLMTLLLAMLGAQTTLGARADTLAMRGAKFAAGNLIPVVGGSVSELLRTVSAGVGYLRGTIGISGVLLLLLVLLPVLAELLLYRLVWQLGASVADLVGCTSEKKLLDEVASLCGYLAAAVSICSSVFILALTLLAHCASAIG